MKCDYSGTLGSQGVVSDSTWLPTERAGTSTVLRLLASA